MRRLLKLTAGLGRAAWRFSAPLERGVPLQRPGEGRAARSDPPPPAAHEVGLAAPGHRLRLPAGAPAPAPAQPAGVAGSELTCVGWGWGRRAADAPPPGPSGSGGEVRGHGKGRVCISDSKD